MDPEQLAQLHPRMSEKVARDAQDIRNRLEEARRMNMDELRELQRSVRVGCSCHLISTCIQIGCLCT